MLYKEFKWSKATSKISNQVILALKKKKGSQRLHVVVERRRIWAWIGYSFFKEKKSNVRIYKIYMNVHILEQKTLNDLCNEI